MARADYRRLLTEAYDIDKPEAPPGELAFYRERVARFGQPVLEAMCGTGRFLVPLLEAGIDIDGVDTSEDMLDACRRKGDKGSLTGRLYHQPLQALELPRPYSFAFCGGGSIGLLAADADVAAALGGLHHHLLPGGRVLVEIETRAAAGRPGTGVRWWKRADGATIVVRMTTRFDARTGIEDGVGIYELFADGRLVETEFNDWVCRYWDPADFTRALDAAGFTDVTVTAAYTDQPAGADDPVLSVTARRPD